MTTTIGILTAASMVVTFAFSAWLLMALNRWTKSWRGKEILRNWSPGAVISAQTAAAILWWQIIVDAPLTYYVLYQVMGVWSIVLNAFIVMLVFVLLPGGLLIVDTAWVRLHRIPPQWTVARVWAWAVLISIGGVVVGNVFPNEVVLISMGVVLIFAAVSAIFLTAWWIVSHPIVAD